METPMTWAHCACDVGILQGTRAGKIVLPIDVNPLYKKALTSSLEFNVDKHINGDEHAY